MSTKPIKIALVSFATATSLLTAVSIPAETAHAVTPREEPHQYQEYITPSYELEKLIMQEMSLELDSEYVKQKAEEEKRAAAEAAAKAAEALSVRNNPVAANAPAAPQYAEIPQGSGASGLVAAARAQIGVMQDCTDLVQNSLAAIGVFERRDRGGFDLGPMDFARFGTRINPADARAGDILLRPGHVFIYTGDGTNHSGVHGGWSNGSTVESPYISNPYDYTVIRLS